MQQKKKYRKFRKYHIYEEQLTSIFIPNHQKKRKKGKKNYIHWNIIMPYVWTLKFRKSATADIKKIENTVEPALSFLTFFFS